VTVAYPTEPLDWVLYLSQRHDAELPQLETFDAYYEGEQGLSYMHPEILAEVQDRLRPVIIGWPQLVVDAIEERLDITGFRLPGAEGADEDLWKVWQFNDLDEQAPQAHVDALALSRSYVAVGSREGSDIPLVTAESPLELYAAIDPRDRRVLAALRRVNEPEDLARVGERTATLYLPNMTVWFDWGQSGWKESHRDVHNLGEVPVTPIVNRPRLRQARKIRSNAYQLRYGRSELASVLPLSDAANKLATDMMVAAEFVAIPQRGFLGVGPDKFRDANGNQLSPTQVLMGQLLAIPGKGTDAKTFEFSTADLNKFIGAINAMAHVVAAMAGLPPQYLGYATDQPASADAIRSAESRLIKRAERKQTAFGGSWERVMRLVRRFQDPSSTDDPALHRMETMWRNAATPTIAQAADRAIKLYAAPAGQMPIVPLRQTREDLGYTNVQIDRMQDEDQKFRDQDPVAALGRQLSMNTTNGDSDGNDRGLGSTGDRAPQAAPAQSDQ
jgi:hypothetical protein